MKINDAAKLSGVTVRTLHYYDEIGLLTPSEVSETGYREYDEASLEKLQVILFFRELEFSLQDIKEIMQNPTYDRQEALCRHRELLLQKRERMDKLLQLLEQTIKGEKTMSFQEFDMSEIEKSKKKYANEVKERWGHTQAYRESEERTKDFNHKKWSQLDEAGLKLLKRFADNRHLSPNSDTALSLVNDWKNYISDNFYTCTNEILAGLGLMYSADQRFTENLDKNGEGTAEFMAAAIAEYVKNN